MIRTIENDELLKLLSERAAVFESLVGDWDDERLSQFLSFKRKYSKLTQLQRDIWYLHTVIGTKKTAELMQVSMRYIQLKMKEIRGCLSA